VIPVDQSVADQTAMIYLTLQPQNALLADADLLIASTALVHDLPLATKNRRHFDRIPELRLESW
jgi:predicted nucleic acid-binding protein